jgi:hypothetical protein
MSIAKALPNPCTLALSPPCTVFELVTSFQDVAARAHEPREMRGFRFGESWDERVDGSSRSPSPSSELDAVGQSVNPGEARRDSMNVSGALVV